MSTFSNDTVFRPDYQNDSRFHYTVIPNALLRDETISPACRWLICYLASNSPNWVVKARQIINHCQPFMGRDQVYALLNEAIEAGYISRQEVLIKGMKRVQYHISTDKKFKKCLPRPEIQDTECQDTENQDAKELPSSKNYQKKEKEEGPKPQECVETASPFLANAKSLSDFFLNKIRERNPQFKEPNLKKWTEEFDRLLRIDKRCFEETRELIQWASTHKWWKVSCLSPEKLRKSFDEMVIQKSGDSEKELIRKNRDYAVKLKEEYPKEMKGMTFDDKYVIHRTTAKEVPFTLPTETFQEALISMFGGTYERSQA